MSPRIDFHKKNVLVMGLGLHGGGVATTQWLVRHGANVTVTDLKSEEKLASSLQKLIDIENSLTFVIGEHREKDFKSAHIVVVNPDVPASSPFLHMATEAGAQLENEATLFFSYCKNPILAVTGTRGKTTTAMWLHHFVSNKWPGSVLAGNVATTPMLDVLDNLDGSSPVILELSSFQLERLEDSTHPPRVAIITNIMRDHLNKHSSMEVYVDAKTHIFEGQKTGDTLVLANQDSWTPYILAKNPQARVLFYDKEPLGISLPGNFEDEWGAHNVKNVKAAAHGAHAFGVSWADIEDGLSSLPHPPFRQETVYGDGELTVVNDTTATTPDGAIAAIEMFKNKGRVILIAGGTDKELDFDRWAQVVQNEIVPEHLVLLEGSATDKMMGALESSFRGKVHLGDSLEKCVQKAFAIARGLERNKIIVFSPGAASFEKFQNEFDRGHTFNSLIQHYLKKGE